MCIRPNYLRNPSYGGLKYTALRKINQVDEETGEVYKTYRRVSYGNVNASPDITDSAFLYTARPCGTCPECLRKQQLQLIQRCLAEAETNHILFCTNTYSNEMLRKIKVGDRELAYADFHDFDNLTRFARKYNVLPQFKVLVCSEYGSKRHRPHFHYLLFIPKRSTDTPTTIFEYQRRWLDHMFKYWARNEGSRKHPVWKPCSRFICKYVRGKLQSTYDCSPVVPNEYRLRLSPDKYMEDESNVAFYVTKYVLKFDKWVERLQQYLRLNFSPDEYKYYWSLLRPRVQLSKFFGSVPEHMNKISKDINHSLTQSDSPYALYYLPDGKGVPLSRYYRSGKLNQRTYHTGQSNEYTIVCLPCHSLLSGADAVRFLDKCTDLVDGSASRYADDRDVSELASVQDSFNSTARRITENNSDICLD